jgi:serine/threonine-protein kinase
MRLGRFELLAPIARGGMAEVWIARLLGDLGFSRIVAIKTIRPDYAEDPAFRSSFFEEARIAARLRHANVVEVFDLGEQGPILFQVMPLVEGDSASRLLKMHQERAGEVGFPTAIALRIMADALAGLHAAHELTDEQGMAMQLVHRDVSPHNILVGVDGVSKLCDFGVAKALGRLVHETEQGQLRGKFGYLSPEQVDRRPLDRRSDLFSAGAVLWELLTGKGLFRGIDALDTLEKVARGVVPDLRALVPSLPAPIAEITLRALARAPAERFSDAAAMIDALDAAALASGLTATTKDVAAFVSALCGTRIDAQRELIRVASGPGLADKEAIAGALLATAQAPEGSGERATPVRPITRTVILPRSREELLDATAEAVAVSAPAQRRWRIAFRAAIVGAVIGVLVGLLQLRTRPAADGPAADAKLTAGTQLAGGAADRGSIAGPAPTASPSPVEPRDPEPERTSLHLDAFDEPVAKTAGKSAQAAASAPAPAAASAPAPAPAAAPSSLRRTKKKPPLKPPFANPYQR